MKCVTCGARASQGVNLYRQNRRGEAGIWACAPHSKPVDDELVRVVAAIQKLQKLQKLQEMKNEK